MLVYELARQKAEEVLKTHRISSTGLHDLVRIANAWGADILVRPLKDGVSGFVVRENGGPIQIYVNELENEFRQRFTLAHEIGHLLDRDHFKDDDYSFVDYRKSNSYDIHEFFADEFAGALLMPAAEFNQALQHGEFFASARFGVSVPVIRKRKDRLEKHPQGAHR